jgi:anaerobic selenocysteine-containing dehydrogenase
MQFHRGVVQRLRRRDRARAPDRRPGAPSRPELPRVLGQMPAVALADEIEAGHVRALLVTGGSPLTAFPQPARLRAALASLEVLAVVDVAENPLTAMATHVLPATGQLERADLTLAEPTALRGGLQATIPVVPAAADRRPVWWMFAALQQAMGRPALGGVDPDLLTDERFLRGVLGHSALDPEAVFAAGARGIQLDDEPGWVHRELLPDGRWSIAPASLLVRLDAYRDPTPAAFVLAPRREMAWSNSVAYGARADVTVVHVHPDARDRGDGPVATLTTAHGTVTANVVADPTLRADVISMTHGHATINPGDLTSGTTDVDPLTAMPRVAGTGIELGGPTGPD